MRGGAYPLGSLDIVIFLGFRHIDEHQIVGPAIFVVGSIHLTPVSERILDLDYRAHQTLAFAGRFIIGIQAQDAAGGLYDSPLFGLYGSGSERKLRNQEQGEKEGKISVHTVENKKTAACNAPEGYNE